MTPEDWQRIKAVSAAALDRPESERLPFIAAACGGNLDIEHEVHSLLASVAQASNLFEGSSFLLPEAAAEILSETTRFTTPRMRARFDRAAARFQRGDLVNGRYRVESLAGEGGMGSVYRVSDTATGRTLALKALGGRIRSVNLFKIEFRTLVELSHPHLARSYDFEPIAGSDDYLFTMDFVDGVNIFETAITLPWPSVLDLVVQLCRALAYVHNRGVVHRDIKPNNVLVAPDGVVKLLDFGLAGTGDELLAAMGTPSYLAPEIQDAHRGDHRSDLYSLGVLTYQLLTHRLPFTGVDVTDLLRQHAYAPIIWPDGSDVPAWLKGIVTQLCAKQPADRFRGANQVIESINQLGGLQYPVDTVATRESYVVSGRFVGRQQELDTVSAFVTQRLTGSTDAAPMVFLAGASGVGKSRLLRELRHKAQLDRQRFIEGHCFEGAAAEYAPLAEALSQLVPLAESSDGGAIVDRYIGELVKIAPALGQHRTIPPAPALTTAEAERARLYDAAASFLQELSGLLPFVLCIDDAHWASRGTIEILSCLRRSIALAEQRGHRVRLALLITYRDEEAAGRPIESLLADGANDHAVIRLAPLTPQAMERLLVSMFGLDTIPHAFVSRVLDDAAGSPFFLEEVVRGLVENGSVFVEHGTWHTASSLGELEIPPTVAAALRRRLAMIVGEEPLELLRLLAAYKKPMPAALIAAVVQKPVEQVDEALYGLSLRQMVTTIEAPERLYRTAHDHLRTTVYDDIGSARPAVHLRIAHGLERLAETRSVPLSELAHHYWAASERENALKYALLAGQSALKSYANDEAIEHLEHALELLSAQASRLRTQTLEQLADAFFLSGRYERANTLLLEVDRNAVEPLDKVRIERKRAELAGYSAGTPGEAVDILWAAARQLGATRPSSRTTYLAGTAGALARHFAQQGLRAVPPAASEAEQRRLAELATTYLRIGYFSFFSDPLLLFLPVLRAANIVDRIPDSREYSQVYSMAGVALAGLGMNERALRYGQHAIQQATRCGTAWQVANAQSFHAIVLLETGHWTDAFDHAERARNAFAACGDHFQLAVSAYHTIEVLHARGDLAAASVRGREEVAVFQRLGLEMIGKGLYTVFGRILAKTGDGAGVVVGREVLELAERGADKLSTVFAEMALADSLLQFERFDEAIDHLERGLAIRDRDRFNTYVVAQSSALLVQAYAARIRATKTPLSGAQRRSFDRRVKQAVSAGRRFAPMRSSAYLSRGLACHLAGRRTEATRCFEEAARHASALGAKLWEADAHFEHGLALLDDQAHSGGRAQTELELARSLYHACGAAPRERQTADALLELQAS